MMNRCPWLVTSRALQLVRLPSNGFVRKGTLGSEVLVRRRLQCLTRGTIGLDRLRNMSATRQHPESPFYLLDLLITTSNLCTVGSFGRKRSVGGTFLVVRSSFHRQEKVSSAHRLRAMTLTCLSGLREVATAMGGLMTALGSGRNDEALDPDRSPPWPCCRPGDRLAEQVAFAVERDRHVPTSMAPMRTNGVMG